MDHFVRLDELREWLIRAFNRLGWPTGDAALLAAVYLDSELRGHESHGVFVVSRLMRKAFGPTAGLVAFVLSILALAALFSLLREGLFPVMVVLGPLMVVQYVVWPRVRGRERTTREYLQAEPRGRKIASPLWGEAGDAPQARAG